MPASPSPPQPDAVAEPSAGVGELAFGESGSFLGESVTLRQGWTVADSQDLAQEGRYRVLKSGYDEALTWESMNLPVG